VPLLEWYYESQLLQGYLDQGLSYTDAKQAVRKWVQSNIEAFGGDPARVILFGESAGAINAGIHLLADGGKGSAGLLHGAILQSGNAASGGRRPPTHAVVESTYSFVLEGAGCADAQGTLAQIACLKAASTSDLTAGNNLAIANSYMGYMPVQDDYFLKGVPSSQWASGQYLNVPIITGNNLDEGTEFPYPLTVSDDVAFQKAQTFALGPDINAIFPQILSTWSSDPAKGGPYRPEFFDVSPEDTFYPPNGTNQYKRQAAMAQDVFFESGRRIQLQSARRSGIQTWSYRFAQPSPVGIGIDSTQVAKASMGVQHEAEIPYVFFNPPIQGANAANIPEPLRTYASDENLVQVSKAMSAAWIHFAYNLDPNGVEVPRWEAYAFDADPDGNGMSLYMQANNFTMTFDDQSNDQVNFVIDNKSYFFL
jgi:carboxylesterase type B